MAARLVAVALWSLLLVLPQRHAAAKPDCQALLKEFRAFNTKVAAPYTPDSRMVYFLHIPRTAGRTFHSCFLKQGFPARKRCPKAYDHLRINFTVPSCHLLSSHDDFSVVQMLPERTAVITQLRDPVDRFLSAYEFAIEVAARVLKRPKGWKPPPVDDKRIRTEDVWPWSILIPWFEQDMKARMKVAWSAPKVKGGRWAEFFTEEGRPYYYNKALNTSKWLLTDGEKELLLPPLDPFNNDLVMPLAEFATHPIAAELLHDNEAMQVLGLSNYSHWQGAADMRDCIRDDPDVGYEMLCFSRDRLATFSHVGTTDQLHGSVESASAALRLPLDGPAYAGAGENRKANIEAKGRKLEADYAAEEDVRDPYAEIEADDKRQALELLAGEVRDKAQQVTELYGEWNELVQGDPPQAQLRRLRGLVGGAEEELGGMQRRLVELREAERRLRRRSLLRSDQADRVLELSLGAEYLRCAAKAQARNKARKSSSLTHLAMPDGRYVIFDKAARAGIPHQLLEDIRRLNPMDASLHALGTEMLGKARAAQKQEGALGKLQPDIVYKGGGGGGDGNGSGSGKRQRRRRRIPLPDELRRLHNA